MGFLFVFVFLEKKKNDVCGKLGSDYWDDWYYCL